jgi:hypothetical protein
MLDKCISCNKQWTTQKQSLNMGECIDCGIRGWWGQTCGYVIKILDIYGSLARKLRIFISEMNCVSE